MRMWWVQMECPGHFGHIELAKPMFHYGYIKTIVKVLRCICIHCSKLKCNFDVRLSLARSFLLARSFISCTQTLQDSVRRITKIKNPMERLKAVYALCSSKSICDRGLAADKANADADGFGGDLMDDMQDTDKGCGNMSPFIRLEGLSITAEYRKMTAEMVAEKVEKKQQLKADRVHSILKRISIEDCLLLGFEPPHTRPDWMVCTVLPVPPPAVRPSVQSDDGKNSQDDLTFKLGDVLKWSANLREQEENGAPAHIVSEVENMLQFHVATLVANPIPGNPVAMTRSGRPLKSISQRLKGKEGRLRGNLMGKRVDFSARTVITPDPNVSIDEVGVPRSIALNLTYPEIVTPFNIDRYVKNRSLHSPEMR